MLGSVRVEALALLVVVIGAVSTGCGSDMRQPPSATGGAAGSTSMPDASVGGAGGSPDGGLAGSGGASGKPSLCGNGMLDPGEQCDDGNSTNRDGCNTNCRFSCTQGDDSPCSDGDFCNGVETCGPNHVCLPSQGPKPDGTVCGDASKCVGGVCKPAAADCGDGLIERPDEECEDGNSVNGDGCDNCRFSCVSTDPTRNCNTGDPCPGIAKCDDSTHTCKPGTPLADLSSCGDGKACVNEVCTDKYCGNGKIDSGEECDDGNPYAGDGCEPNCKYSCSPSDPTRNCQSTNVCIASGACDTGTHECTPLLPKPAGTACMTDQNCIEGNCVAPVCGDGVKAPSEACDDGIQSSRCTDQCKPACSTDADCAGKAPTCRSPKCTGGACTTRADSSQNGNSCTTGNGTATCNNGACTAGTCGDGVVDQGEECDDQNTTNGDGCDSCRFSCSNDSDCDDGNSCNGDETCATVTGGKACVAGTAKAAGTACGTGKICTKSVCHLSFCGDGYTDKSKGESCDPPNTVGCDSSCKALETCNLSGNWAMKVSAQVTWSGGALVDGMGEIDQWALLQINQPQGSTAFQATLRPCGISIPDFHTTPDFGDEQYGLTFAGSAFDSSKMPTFTVNGQVSNLAPGATFTTTTVAILVGVSVKSPATPFDKWPDLYSDLIPSNGYALVDVDGDGNPGITATAKTGTVPNSNIQYHDIIWDLGPPPLLSNPGRAGKLYLAIREIASENGTLKSCTQIGGATSAIIDNHIVGCLPDDPTATCVADLADAARPLYETTSASFIASFIDTETRCSAVRAKVP